MCVLEVAVKPCLCKLNGPLTDAVAESLEKYIRFTIYIDKRSEDEQPKKQQ